MYYNRNSGGYSANYSANQYRTNSVNTSPLQLVVMCYDGMLRFLRQVKKAIEEKDIESRVKYTNKTLAILDELQNTLDFARGGDIAKNLDRVYSYISARLLKATIKNDLDTISHVEKLITELRTAWADVAKNPTGTGNHPASGLSISG